MLYLVFIIMLIPLNITPAYANEIEHFSNHLSSGTISDQIFDSKDLVYRDGIAYKKYTNVPFTGKVTGKEKGYLNEGKWNGPYVSYYNTGQLEQKGSYKNAKKDGPWKFFRNDGNIISEGYYNNGQKEGTWNYYHLFGTKLQMVKTFKNGKKNGVFKAFYGNGNLMQKGSYKSGKPNGLWISYEKNGKTEKDKKIY